MIQIAILLLCTISIQTDGWSRIRMNPTSHSLVRLTSKDAVLQSKLQPRNDTIIEKAAIFSLSFLLSTITPNPQVAITKLGTSYSNFVDVSKLMLQAKTPDVIKDRIVDLLLKVLPKIIRDGFASKYIESPRWVCESSVTWFGFGFLEWLVGPAEGKANVLTLPNGTTVEWKSTVKLTECRYLVESGCKAACTQLCKRPTQAFFNEQLGVPLYMKPNFTDFSCEFQFGVNPPVDADDEAFKEPCFSVCNKFNILDDRCASNQKVLLSSASSEST
jgi:Beta-carotene isomerase D27-like, C-terminal